jgi:hypothetical protein
MSSLRCKALQLRKALENSECTRFDFEGRANTTRAGKTCGIIIRRQDHQFDVCSSGARYSTVTGTPVIQDMWLSGS